MTGLLSVLNVLFFILYSGSILQFGRKRYLSERSNLICLGAGILIFVLFQSHILWDLLLDYPAHTPLYHFMFVIFWGTTGAITYGCLKLTEISRIKRKLVQDLALLNFEPSAQASVIPDLLAAKTDSKS